MTEPSRKKQRTASNPVGVPPPPPKTPLIVKNAYNMTKHMYDVLSLTLERDVLISIYHVEYIMKDCGASMWKEEKKRQTQEILDGWNSCTLTCEPHYESSIFASACAGGNFAIIKWFLKTYEKEIDVAYGKGYAFRLVCANGKLDVAKWLLEHYKSKIDIGACSYAAYENAAINGHLNIVKFLMDLDKEKKECYDMDGSVLQTVAAGGYLEIIKYIVDSKVLEDTEMYGDFDPDKVEGWLDSAPEGNIEMITYLVELNHSLGGKVKLSDYVKEEGSKEESGV